MSLSGFLAQKIKGVRAMNTNEVVSKIRELRELQALIDEAGEQAEGIKDAIKAYMGAQEELRAGSIR
jgi:hypothetical protein